MRVLITGSSGQIGTNLALRLLEEGHSVFGIDITILPSRTGEVTRYIANIGKATALLGYRPSTPLREGIGKAVPWCLDWWAQHKDE